MRIAYVAILAMSPVVMAQVTTAPPAPRVKIYSSGSGAYFGVMVQEIDSDRTKALKLPEEAGVEITHVSQDSPAEKAGLKVGDVILRFNGERVIGMAQFQRLISETPVGREVKLDVYRSGAPQTLTVKAGVRHESREPNVFAFTPPATAPRAYEFVMPDMPRSFMSWSNSMLGIVLETLDGQLAQFFGVKEGVLVRSVNSGSPAEKAGMKAGDVITRVDDSKVTTPADVSNRLRSMHGKSTPLVVMRDHKEITLTLTIEDDHRAEWFRQNYDEQARRYFGDDFLVTPAAPPAGGWFPNSRFLN